MDSTSLYVRKRGPILTQMHIFFLVQYELTDRQHVHPRSQEAVDRLNRCLNNWLILIKGRVQQHRHPRHVAELAYQFPIPRIQFTFHRLEPAGSVSVRH